MYNLEKTNWPPSMPQCMASALTKVGLLPEKSWKIRSNLECPPCCPPSTRGCEEHRSKHPLFWLLTLRFHEGTAPAQSVGVLLGWHSSDLISSTRGWKMWLKLARVCFGIYMIQREEKRANEILCSKTHVTLKLLRDHFSHHRYWEWR